MIPERIDPICFILGFGLGLVCFFAILTILVYSGHNFARTSRLLKGTCTIVFVNENEKINDVRVVLEQSNGKDIIKDFSNMKRRSIKNISMKGSGLFIKSVKYRFKNNEINHDLEISVSRAEKFLIIINQKKLIPVGFLLDR